MGGCCVVEDTNQNVDRDEKPSFGEKDPYISGHSLVCAAPDGGLDRHLSSPPQQTLELLRDLAVGKDSAAPHGDPSVPSFTTGTSHGTFSRIAGTSRFAALTCRTASSPMRLDGGCPLNDQIISREADSSSNLLLPETVSDCL